MRTSEPVLAEEDIRSLEEVIAWVRRAKNDTERLERALGMEAFVKLHPRLRRAAQHYRPTA